MKNPLNPIKIIFSIIGIIMLIGAYFMTSETLTFLETAKQVQAEVIALTSRNSSGTYAPIVRFKLDGGKVIEFESTTSSNPPDYTVGEKVEVLYNPERPEDAEINSFFSLWGGGLILGGLGIIFSCVGFGIIWYEYSKKNLKEKLLMTGESIYSTFTSVEYRSNIKLNGRSPYQIISQWQNPATSQIHVFKSENIFYDPTEYITDNNIKVYLDTNNPKKYYVDVSFLPSLSE